MTLAHLYAQLLADGVVEIVELGHQCEDHDHGGVRCCSIATSTNYWPGRSCRQCARHTAWAVRVAQALGFELHRKPLPVWKRDEPGDDAAIRFSLMELT